MVELIHATGKSGFHFVDEAAPPALMKEIALEIVRRKLVGTWWANIRFEQSFTPDLCRLLKASGCIAVRVVQCFRSVTGEDEERCHRRASKTSI